MTEGTKCSKLKLCDKDDCKECFNKSFASHEKAKFWSNKNELKPRQVFKSSGKKFLFDCECDHQFESALSMITTQNCWCPYCSGNKLCGKKECNQCYNKSFASHEKAKYWSNKNKLNSSQVFLNSNNKFLFNCICGHEFEQMLNSTSSGSWCPYCSTPSKILCDNKDCKECFNKSFASHEKAKYWSIKNKLKPIQVFLNSAKKYIFDCNCGHEFEQLISQINIDIWCPYCSNKKLCDNKDCKNCFSKSFASHETAKYWSNKNELKSNQVFKSSGKKYIFDCNCGHEFSNNLDAITGKNNWCPYCSKTPIMCDNNDCKQCFNKSFASHEKAKYWSNKNKEKPRNFLKSIAQSFYFICKYGHEFKSSLNNISGGQWCPFCVNKTEQKLFEQLITLYPTLQQQFKVAWCKKKTYLPFDFVIPEYNIIIELDGAQHFRQVSNWASPEETNINDKYKMECANKNNYSIIRLTQEDVFYDTYDWIDELNQNIQKIINEKVIQNIYMCKNNEYRVFNDQSDELVV